MTAQTTLECYVDHEALDEGGGIPKHDYRCEWLEERLGKFLHGKGRRYGPKGAREELRKVIAGRQKSLVVSFEQILEFDMELAFRLINGPTHFLSLADRILEETTGIQGVHLRVREMDRTSRARAKKIGEFIMVWGHVVGIADGGSRIKIQDLPKVWIHKLDAPLEVKPWPGWGASWPLLCTIPIDLVGTVGFGDFAEATGMLTVKRDERVDPAKTRGWHYVLEVNHIETLHPKEYVPRGTTEKRAISDLFERLFGYVDKLTIIDKHNVYRGTFPDTPGFRVKLKILGFEIAGGVATKKYTDHKEVL